MGTMKVVELTGSVNDAHKLHAHAPAEWPAGPVRVLVILPGNDDSEGDWEAGVAREWHAELADTEQDLYSLSDGTPV
jgi:hypothetical protein